VVIDRASHSANMEQPGPTAAALLEFWAALGPVARPGPPARPEPAAVRR
jgi:hypothetical protein